MAETILSTQVVADPAIKTATAFLNQLWPEPRNFAIRLWDGTTLPAKGESRFKLVIKTRGALRHMFKIPLELALGEAFIRNEFDIEGDMIPAFSLFNTIIDNAQSLGYWLKLIRLFFKLPVTDETGLDIQRGAARLSGVSHSRSRDIGAIQYHYDVGNDFYSLWLDKRMVYTCAYFPTGTEDLDTAQERKLDHICRKLRLKPDEYLLDIGCGWGGMIIYAAQHYGVRALGVTLSKQQYDLATQRIAAAGLTGQVEVRLMDYRDLKDVMFDKIVSIGMFEAVGRSQLPTYFAKSYSLLKPRGLFLNHGISINLSLLRANRSTLGRRLADQFIIQPNSFIFRYVFPDGELVPVSDLNFMAEAAGYEVRDVENLREHYARTLRLWVSRLIAHHEDVVKVSNESVFRTWRAYMSGSAAGFDTGMLNLNQTLLAKMDHGKVTLPDNRADLYTADYYVQALTQPQQSTPEAQSSR